MSPGQLLLIVWVFSIFRHLPGLRARLEVTFCFSSLCELSALCGSSEIQIYDRDIDEPLTRVCPRYDPLL